MLRGKVVASTKSALCSRSGSILGLTKTQSTKLFKSPVVQQTMTYATKKSFSQKSGGSDEKRRTTPAKNRDGFIHSFAHTAPYSNFHLKAPKVTNEKFDLSNELFKDVDVRLSKSTVYEYSDKSVSSLIHLGSFHPDQKNELFNKHVSLFRSSSSAQIFDIIKAGRNSPSNGNRFCITGAKGAGKTTAMTHAQFFGIEQGYVVIHITRALDLISGRYDALAVKNSRLQSSDSNSRVFNQPMYIGTLMRKIAKANEDVLKSIKLSKDYDFPASRSFKPLKFTKADSLYTMLINGRIHIEKCEVFNAFLEELSKQTQAPVLFTMDDFNAFSHHPYAINRDVDNNPIYHGELQLPKIFLDFFSGERTFQNGVIIAGLSSYKNGYTIPHGLGQGEPYAYAKSSDYDPTLAGKMRANGGVKALNIESLTLEETETLLNYYSSGKIIHQPVDESFVQQKYFLSGNGNPLALLKSCIEVY